MDGASIEAQRYTTNIKEGTGSASTFASNQRAIQASMSETSIVSKAAAVGLNLFKAALNSLIFFAAIEGIRLLIKGIDDLILTAQEAEEKSDSLRNSTQSFFDDVQSGQQTISSISDRFSELSEHVTKTGENIDLTKDEYSEYLDICNQVKDIMPELVTGYTNEGNAIITLKDNVDSLTESYKENIKAKAASFITNGDDGNTIQSFFDDYDVFTNGENGLFAPSAGGLWNNKSTDYEDYYGYDKVHEWLSDVSEMSLKDLQNLQKGTTEATYLYALLKENGYELANITEDDYNAVHDVLNTRLTSLEGEMATRVSNIKMSLQQMLYADGDYWNIDNKEALSALDSFFASIDDEFIKQNNLLSQTALQSFESNAVDLFQNNSTKQSMIDIFSSQGEDETIKNYTTRVENAISEIQKYCDENGIAIPFNFGTEDGPKGVQKIVDDLQKSYDDAISSAKEKYNITMSEDNLSAVEYYNEATESAEKYRNSLDDIYKSYNGINNIDRDIIYWDDESLEKYKSYIDSWGESAEDLRNSWSTVLGTSENIDGVEVAFTAMLQTDHGLVPLEQDTFWQYFDEIFNQSWNEDGTFDAEKFIQLDKEGTDMIINGQMEHVANMIAAAEGQYMNGVKLTADDVIAIGTPGYDKNGKDLMPDNNSKYKGKSMHEVQEWALENRYALAQLDEQAKKTNTSVNGLIAEAGKYDGNTDWDSWFAENVRTQEDIDNWRKIQQSCNDATEAKKKYLETDITDKTPVSFTDAISQVQSLSKGLDQLGKIYTDVLNGEDFDWSSILNNDDFKEQFGNMTNVTSEYADAYDDFIETISNSPSDINACQDAFNNLATAYINNSGCLENVTEETKDATVAMLEQMGVTNAEEVVSDTLAAKTEALALQEQFLADNGYDIANATNSKIASFLNEAGASETARAYLFQLVATEQVFNNQDLNAKQKIEELEKLATAYGQTAIAAKIANMEKASEAGHTQIDYDKELASLQNQINNAINNIDIDFKPLTSASGKAGKAGKEAADEYLENFEKMQNKLKDLYDQGKITTKQYYDALRALAEKYLKDREKYADKLAEIEQEYAKGMKELYDTVISGVISKIDKRISALNDQKDAAVSALEAEEEAAKKVLEAQKEALQVEIDAIDKQISAKQELIDSINDEADAKQRAYDLDKAQYELDRLRNQKTIYEYSGKEKGFIYKTDDKAIRDQEQEVDDKKREIRIANIEKEISALEKRKSALEEQQNAIDDQIDAISDYYEELIANTEAYWDEIIKGMEETKTKWEELQELQENAELEMNLRSLGYEGGIDEVLALTDEQFAQFKNNYLQYIAGMNQGNQSFIDSLSQISGVDIGNLPDIFKETQEYIDMLGQGIDFTNLDASLSGVISGFTKIADEAGIATGAIIGGTATTSANSSGNKNGAQGENGQSSSGSGDSLNGGIKTMSEESVPKINEVANAFAGSEEGEDTGTSVAGSAQKASKAISSGKDSGGEEDESLQGSIKTQVEAAVDEEEGIPKQTEAWSGLNEMLGSIKENLDAIKTLINEISNMDLSGLSAIGGIKIVGGAGVDGTAFASGTLGKVSDNGVALGGELGREMVVRDGRFFTVGDNGAELFHHKKGDIIFNHKQTQDILKNGHTNSRGKAFAGGNVNSLPKEYSLPSQEVMDRMAKLEAGFNSLDRDESLLVQMQIRDNTKKIYEQNARAIQEVQKYNKSNSTSNTYNYSIDAIELPNVMNGEDFYRDIRRLNTLIKQQGNTRK